MRLTIEPMRGVWRAQLDSRTVIAETLEDLLAELAPDAPAAYIYHAGELLGGILGAEVVELPEIEQPDLSILFDELMRADPGQPPPFVPLPDDMQPWQPTEAQQAYFNPEVEGDGA